MAHDLITAGGAVLGQKIAQGRVDAEKVVQRLDILVAVEPAVDDPSLALLLRPAEPVQFAAEGVQEGPIHFRGGPFFLLRRHLAAVDLIDDLMPGVRRLAAEEIRTQFINAKARLRLLQEGAHVRRSRPRAAGVHLRAPPRDCLLATL